MPYVKKLDPPTNAHIKMVENWCADAPHSAKVGDHCKCGLVLERKGVLSKVRRYQITFDDHLGHFVKPTVDAVIEWASRHKVILDEREIGACRLSDPT